MVNQSEITQKLSEPDYCPRPEPTAIPTALWNDNPLYCLQLNDEWVSHVLGVMNALDQYDTWVGTDDEIDAARQQVNEIMLALMSACPPIEISLFSDDDTPANFAEESAITLGVEFKSSVAGKIIGLKFYKSDTAFGLHRGQLWSEAGDLLGDMEYNTETSSGWQRGYFNHPISIDADTVYIASHSSLDGHYGYDLHYFDVAHTNTPLIAPMASDVTLGNGVYKYGDVASFPNETSGNNTNYWADVIFLADTP